MSIKKQLLIALIFSIIVMPPVVIGIDTMLGYERSPTKTKSAPVKIEKAVAASLIIYSELLQEHRFIAAQIEALKK